MLFCEDVTLEHFACFEGMDEWRSLGEIFIWCWAKTLLPVRAVALREVENVVAGKLSDRDAVYSILISLGKILRSEFVKDSLARVVSVNIQSRQGLISYRQGRAEGVVDAFPAEELFCSHDRLTFARDWHAAWAKAGGKFYGGRMIARKDSPVWLVLSDFGLPFPPFSFDDSMWVRDVDGDEAARLGLPVAEEIVVGIIFQDAARLVGVE